VSEVEAITAAMASKINVAVQGQNTAFVLMMVNVSGEFHVASNLDEAGMRQVIADVARKVQTADPPHVISSGEPS